MKCGELKCRLCGKDAMQCAGWLQRVGIHGDPNAPFECRPSCYPRTRMDNAERLLGAIEQRQGMA